MMFFLRIIWWFDDHSEHLLVGILSIALVLAIFAPKLFVTIDAGERGVIYRPFDGGTATAAEDIYEEGVHTVFPWNKMHVYNVRQQTTNWDFEVMTQNALPVKISLEARYHPEREQLGMLHKELGQDYVKKVVIPEVTSAARKVFASYDLEDLFGNFYESIEELITKMAAEEMEEEYIEVVDISIKDIELPKELTDAIGVNLSEWQKKQSFQAVLEKERKEKAEREAQKAATAPGHY